LGSSKHQRCQLGFFFFFRRRAHSSRATPERLATTARRPPFQVRCLLGSFSISSDPFVQCHQSLPPFLVRMANGSEQLRLWCSALACALLALVEADGLFVDITYLESAVAKGAGQSHIPASACFNYALPIHLSLLSPSCKVTGLS
jgi:hypothetical protein